MSLPRAFMTPPHLENCRTWNSYHASYLKWMQKHNHPDLKKMNYNAEKFKENMELNKMMK